jgi:hypothetical protein
MGVQAIDQTTVPEVLGKTNVFYFPRSREHEAVDIYGKLTFIYNIK